jgi:hypothetical protein
MFATQGTALVLEIIIGVFTILAGFAGGIRWLTKHYFDEIKGELKTNGGSSIKDQVNRLESDIKILKDHMVREEAEQDSINKKVDKIYDIILDLVSKKSN